MGAVILPGRAARFELTDGTQVETGKARAFGNLVLHGAGEMGFDKVSAATVLLDLAVDLMRRNEPAYPPETVREAFERALDWHFPGERRRIV